MKVFVILTGIMNIMLGLIFTMPEALLLMGLTPPENLFWLMFPAIFITILGVILLYCAKDLKNRSTIIMWDGMTRVMAFLSFLGFGLFGDLGIDKLPIAVPDLIIAIVYFIGLPRALGSSFLKILFDMK